PALCTDAYGPKFAATNAGFLYTAKGAASFLVPAASWLQSSTGSWHAVFVVAAIANVAVAATALLVVKPLRAAVQRGAVAPVAVNRIATAAKGSLETRGFRCRAGLQRMACRSGCRSSAVIATTSGCCRWRMRMRAREAQ